MHAGTDLHTIRKNLLDYAVPIRDEWSSFGWGDHLGVGLWIPDEASRQLSGNALDEFADFLRSELEAAYDAHKPAAS